MFFGGALCTYKRMQAGLGELVAEDGEDGSVQLEPGEEAGFFGVKFLVGENAGVAEFA